MSQREQSDKKCPSQLDSWEAVHAYEHATRRGMGMLPGGPALFEQLCALAKSTFAPSSTATRSDLASRLLVEAGKLMEEAAFALSAAQRRPKGPYRTSNAADGEDVMVLDSYGEPMDADGIVALLNTYSGLAASAIVPSATASAESAYERARREHPEAGRCKCGQHEIPARFDGINWYWQRHSREGCTLELPNSVCWCGLLRHEHTDGHQKGVESPLREQTDISRSHQEKP